MGLQAPSPRVAGSIAQGCRLHHIGLQAPSHRVAGTLNIYLPLTRIGDTNSLYVESQPGSEDFHPLTLEVQ